MRSWDMPNSRADSLVESPSLRAIRAVRILRSRASRVAFRAVYSDDESATCALANYVGIRIVISTLMSSGSTSVRAAITSRAV